MGFEYAKGDCVYIMKCADDTFYTGWTVDIAARLKMHNSGKGAKYTRSRLPVKPVYLEYVGDKSEGLKREHEIKKLSRAQKEELINSERNQIKV